MQEKLTKLANTDALTSLHNRRYLFEVIEHLRNEQGLCLVYIDIDDFKMINDRFGHDEGDKVLIAIAQNLSEQFPEQMIFRMGGDEFLVVSTIKQGKRMVIEQVENFLYFLNNESNQLHKFSNLSASIGIAFDTDIPFDFTKLLRQGDEALYKAKANGKNQYHIWAE